MSLNNFNPLRKRFFLRKKYKYNKKNVIKKLFLRISKSTGRNHKNKILTYNKGGGVLKKYRKITTNNNLQRIYIIRTLEKDPYRTSFIMGLQSIKGSFIYKIAPFNIKLNTVITNFNQDKLVLGSTLKLCDIPINIKIHNIENIPNNCTKYIRAAGTFGVIIKKTKKKIFVKMPSKKIMVFHPYCLGSIGIVSNKEKKFNKLYKAGQSRLLNKRPAVRGIAMNPVDHPHGGRSNGGKLCRTPWGLLTKGVKTSKNKKKKYIF